MMSTFNTRLATLAGIAMLLLTSAGFSWANAESGSERYRNLLRKAESGDSQAQTDLALMRIEGKTVPRDLRIARIWLGKAALQNDVNAQFYLGQLLMLDALGARDQELKQQLTEGLGWLRRAAREQHRQAQLLYAQTVLDSNSETPLGHSKIEAEALLLQCADKHQPCTVYALAKLDKQPLNSDVSCTTDERCETIRRLLYSLANAEDTQAMVRLAGLQGEDTMFWIRRAARLGNAQASYELARLVLEGDVPVQPEDPSVLNMLNTSAQAGETEAMFLLGQLLFEGKRFPVNRPLAMDWLNKAASLGHAPSATLLDALKNKAPEASTTPNTVNENTQ